MFPIFVSTIIFVIVAWGVRFFNFAFELYFPCFCLALTLGLFAIWNKLDNIHAKLKQKDKSDSENLQAIVSKLDDILKTLNKKSDFQKKGEK